MITVADPLDLDVLRIRHEFLTVPDLRLSPQEIAASLHVTRHHAEAMLDTLVTEQFLARVGDGAYARTTSIAKSAEPAERRAAIASTET